MNSKTEIAVTVICMVVMFIAGASLGTDNTTYEVDRPATFQNVNYTGEIYHGRYVFNFTETIDENELIYGRTWPHRDEAPERILIKTGRPAEEVLETCRHEVLHHFFPEYDHPDFSKPGVLRNEDPIYRLDDQVDLGICKVVVGEALTRQR